MLQTIFGLSNRGQIDQRRTQGCARVRRASHGEMNRLLFAFVALALSLAAPGWCHGAVTNVRLYRLGENDIPAFIPGGAGDDPTMDQIMGINAMKIGLTSYTGNAGGGGGVGLAPGSIVAMDFLNIDSRYVALAALGGVTENFGMEVYIQVNPGVVDARAFYNGGDGFPFWVPPVQGYGLGVSGGQYAAFVGGATFLTGVPAVPLTPVEMALVNTGGPNFEVYIQKALVLSFAMPVVPPGATDVLSMGNFLDNGGAHGGTLDEARVFTFLPGGFDAKTDLN